MRLNLNKKEFACQPHSKKNQSFEIVEIEYFGEKKVNKILSNKIKIYKNNPEAIKKFNIFINSKSTKATITKDKKGNPTQFSMGISITLKINNEIEKIQGIESIETLRTDLNRSTPGLSFCVFNPIYNGKDKKVFDTRCKLKPYQIPYIESPVAFKDKIVVKSQVTNKRVVEY